METVKALPLGAEATHAPLTCVEVVGMKDWAIPER